MKNTFNDILKHYEKEEKTKRVNTDVMSESNYELWEYLCGDEDVRHLYNYYDIQTLDNKSLTI
jgi:hypothetical protein